MAHRFLSLALASLLALLLASCFKDEPLGTECDIEQAFLHADVPDSLFYSAADSLITVLSAETSIKFRVREGADLSALAPQFVITPGATISPASGSVHDFSDGQVVVYTVTSEDGQWQRTYTVAVTIRQRTVDELEVFGFERFYLDDYEQYYIWNDTTADGYDLDDWASGNAGYQITNSSATADMFPTRVLDEGVSGHGVKLVTLSTGALGEMVGKPIAAGNLFLGKFDLTKTLTNSLQATQFGVPVAKRPVTLSGYYKYARGEEYTDADGRVADGVEDSGNIYALIYKNTDAAGNAYQLYGDSVKTSGQLVALADLTITQETDEWTFFELDFSYQGALDEALLEAYGYSVTIVCTSSEKGASFMGAIGSTLCVDELKITWE